MTRLSYHSSNLSLIALEAMRLLVLIETTIPDKIFETYSIFRVKSRITGNAQFLFSGRFLLVFTKLLFWEED